MKVLGINATPILTPRSLYYHVLKNQKYSTRVKCQIYPYCIITDKSEFLYLNQRLGISFPAKSSTIDKSISDDIYKRLKFNIPQESICVKPSFHAFYSPSKARVYPVYFVVLPNTQAVHFEIDSSNWSLCENVSMPYKEYGDVISNTIKEFLLTKEIKSP